MTGETQPTTPGTDPYAPPLPRAVRAQKKRTEELVAQLAAEQRGEAPPDGDQPQGENIAPVDTPPSEPPPAPQGEPPHQGEPPRADPDWEQRYRSLQGKYDREIPQLRSQVQSLEGLIANMRSAPPPPPPASASAPPPPPAQVSDEDLQAFGPELVEASQRWADARFAPVIADLRAQIATLKSGQDRQQVTETTSKLERDLDRDSELGNGVWQRMNHDPEFIQWLQEIDPFSGVSRYVMLNHAYSGGDAERTGRFFKAYLREHTDRRFSPTPPPPTFNGTSNGGANGMGQPRLEDFAAPGRAPRATPGSGAPEKRIWTNRDISAFYDDRTRGRFRGREEEADRLERDIFDAMAEGRIHNA